MTKRSEPERQAVYDVLENWKDDCLRRDESLFVAGRQLWNESRLERLRTAFTERSDVGVGGFLDRVAVQLRDAGDDVVLLFAEVLAVHLLVSVAVSGARKRQIVSTVLDMMDDPATLPPSVEQAFDQGLINPGVAYNSYRANQLQYLIDAMIAYKSKSPERQEDLLADPWAFKELAFGIEHHAAYTQQLALLHMVHPDTFEPIVSRKHRDAIIDAFSGRVDDGEDQDRALADIRASLDQELPDGMGTFYDPEVHRMWDPARADVFDKLERFARLYPNDHLAEDERNYKLRIADTIRELMDDPTVEDWSTKLSRVVSANLVHHVSADRFRAVLDAHHDVGVELIRGLLDDDEPLVDRIDEFSDALRDHADQPIGRPGGHLAIVGALLLAADDDYAPFLITRVADIHKLLGESVPEDVTVGERYVEWLQLLDDVRAELATRGRMLTDRLDVQGLLWQMGGEALPKDSDPVEARAFADWRAKRLGSARSAPEDVEVGGAERPVSSGQPSLDLSALATRLHVSEAWLKRIHDVLVRKRQVIFYGPPGTGKTFVARELARHVAGDRDRVEVVQFHPSYSYEDFIEGFRPSVTDGSIGYSLQPGPLKTLADEARDADHRHVLLVDEINRANLPKVFGELLYLLEYRDEEIRLQYSREPFSLPENLLVIGTMNTADRSIALIDAALRRRFTFVPFFPHEGEIKGLLRRYLEGQERQTGLWVADALDGVNAELRTLLGGPHLQIGPSHFMVAEDVDLDLRRIEEIWDFSIHPYIEEQLFGREEQIARFTFAEVRDRYAPEDVGAGLAGEAREAYDVEPDEDD